MGLAEIPVESAKSFIATLENNEREKAEGYLADEFLFSGWTPRPLGKRAFVNMIAELKEGLPDLSFHLHNVEEEGELLVTGLMQVTGYQSDSFILPELGLPPIPQTASQVSLPVEKVRFRFIDQKIEGMTVTHAPGGGIQGLLRQLGIELPIVQ